MDLQSFSKKYTLPGLNGKRSLPKKVIGVEIAHINSNISVTSEYQELVDKWRFQVSKNMASKLNISGPYSYLEKSNLLRDAIIPKSWDWRTMTGADGSPILMPTKDQQDCGSCYAFAITQMAAHRLSILTNGQKKVPLSAQDIVSSGPRFINETFNNRNYASTIQQLINQQAIIQAQAYDMAGCNGGLLGATANYIVMRGVPANRDVPYLNANTSSITIDPNYYIRTDIDRYFASSAQNLVKGLENGIRFCKITTYHIGIDPQTVTLAPEDLNFNILNMQLAIMTHGPIVTAVNIFTDFFYYPSTGNSLKRRH